MLKLQVLYGLSNLNRAARTELVNSGRLVCVCSYSEAFVFFKNNVREFSVMRTIMSKCVFLYKASSLYLVHSDDLASVKQYNRKELENQ